MDMFTSCCERTDVLTFHEFVNRVYIIAKKFLYNEVYIAVSISSEVFFTILLLIYISNVASNWQSITEIIQLLNSC